MRILLVGEYSRLHNSLKEGLTKLGHDVVIVGNGDGFKNYPVDIFVDHSFHKPLLKKLKVAFYKLTSIDLGSIEVYLKALYHFKKMKGFDVVQLINESPLVIQAKYEKRFIKRLLKHNKKLFLLSCGIDHQCMTFMMDGKFRYSIMSPYLADESLHKLYKFQLQYLNPEFTNLHHFIYKHANGIIATDMDYHLPLLGHSKYLGLIPNAINTEKIKCIPFSIDGKIKIFHGVNKSAVVKKGNKYFEEALKIIEQKYPDKVEIKTTYSIPYEQYIKLYDECHILLDQAYGYDQGYNALEAMAKGKVVFTGAEKEWLDYYGLEKNKVAINAKPEVDSLVKNLEWLITNPEQIISISNNARAFIEKEHNYINIAGKYVDIWNKN
ncbi:glycosyltransferase [uncultured Psychroserpens sp.]|uniref:glycosyltransferase family protein n=1 Tax=uncultured Psychroserpens sp. TaxID=255436 RepID=UPI00262480C9|nr:glycosyltransferase [uncultured Psychroserpens sp.]